MKIRFGKYEKVGDLLALPSSDLPPHPILGSEAEAPSLGTTLKKIMRIK